MLAESDRSVGWCACAAQHVTLDVSGGPDGKASPSSEHGESPVGIALLRIDSRAAGGPLARAWLDFHPQVWADDSVACADTMLDGWIADHHFPPPTGFAEAFEKASYGGPLRRTGFRAVSSVAEGRPFSLVDSAAGDCMLALSDGDLLSLRVAGGARVASDAKALAWCSSTAMTATVWRSGAAPGAVLVVEAAAARVGGLLGARECAAEAGQSVPPQAAWVRDEDLGWDAASILRASTLKDVAVEVLPLQPGVADGRVTALALSSAAKVVSTPPGVAVACDPPLETSPVVRESVCANAGPVAWWRHDEVSAGAARAPLPFWLDWYEPHHNADAIARIPGATHAGAGSWRARASNQLCSKASPNSRTESGWSAAPAKTRSSPSGSGQNRLGSSPTPMAWRGT